MVTVKVSGSYRKTRKFLTKAKKLRLESILKKYGEKGVKALEAATPKDTGETAKSWEYVIRHETNGPVLIWRNTNIVDGVSIAVILQYGHGTGTGGYVQGRDYINPALRPIFDDIAKSAWKEVTES